MKSKKTILGLGVLALGLFAIGFGVAKVSFDNNEYKYSQLETIEYIPVINMGETPDDIDLELQEFINNSLHFNDVNTDDMGTGHCKSSNWYNDAKTSYNALSEDAKNRLAESVSFAEARDRFQAWAKANHEVIDFVNHEFIGDTPLEEGNSMTSKIIVGAAAGGLTVGVGAFVGIMIFRAKHV